MLKIQFGDMPGVNYGPSWFRHNYLPEWFKDSFIQNMILSVDQTRYIDGTVFDSPVLGPIPPERLSGGVQTLIMIEKHPELIFDATSCGDNCAHWLLEIGKRQDVTVNLNYPMRFQDEPFDILILNENQTVHTFRDYVMMATKYV